MNRSNSIPRWACATQQEPIESRNPDPDVQIGPAPVSAAELLLRMLLTEVQGAAWVTDAQLCFIYWMGRGPVEEDLLRDALIGRPLSTVFGRAESTLPLITGHDQALRGTATATAVAWRDRYFMVRIEPLIGDKGIITGTRGIACDVTAHWQVREDLRVARAELDQQVGMRTTELQRLYAQAQEAAVLEERQRLARDLHDAVTQMLFSASLIAEVLPRIWERDPAAGRQHLADLRLVTRGAQAEMRTLLLELRPAALTEASLGDLLQQLADALTGKLSLPVLLTFADDPGARLTALPPDVQLTLYRVTQEALHNITKHAHAHQVRIHLDQRPGAVDLTIDDDGQGFDVAGVAAHHLGLGIMRERVAAIGGTLTINSQPSGGTHIRVRWPG